MASNLGTDVVVTDYIAYGNLFEWTLSDGTYTQGDSEIVADESFTFTGNIWIDEERVVFTAPVIVFDNLSSADGLGIGGDDIEPSLTLKNAVVNFDNVKYDYDQYTTGEIIFENSKLNLTANSDGKQLIKMGKVSGTITLVLDDSFVSGSSFTVKTFTENNLVINNADGYEVIPTTDGTITTYTVNRVSSAKEIKQITVGEETYLLKDETARNGLKDKQDVIPDLDTIRSGAEKGENALPSTTKYGSSLSLTIDGQTYILTAQLRDQDGDNLGTEQTIDLPLETMIVGGSYDEDTKEVVLTLKNGETLRFSISDLISGLVTTDTEQTITGPKTFTQPMKIQNGQGTGSIWIGGNVNSSSLTNRQRHLARIVVPSFDDITVGATLLGFDTSGDSDGHTANKAYDSVAFGGSKKITNATSPMNIVFCVTKERGSTSASDKVYPLEMDGSEARFNVQPNYNGKDLATEDYVDGLVGDIETALNNINSGG